MESHSDIYEAIYFIKRTLNKTKGRKILWIFRTSALFNHLVEFSILTIKKKMKAKWPPVERDQLKFSRSIQHFLFVFCGR